MRAKKAPNKMIPARDYGCLKGLVEAWGSVAPEFLRRTITLRGWDNFNSAVKMHLAETGINSTRYYVWPTLTFIRRFWFIAVEVFLFELQAAGEVTAQQSNQLLGRVDELTSGNGLRVPEAFSM